MPEIQGDVRERTGIREPDLFDVVLLNDDFTTMEFVVDVLMRVFFRTEEDATMIMMAVHRTGQGVAGTYPFDIAVSKAEKAMAMARSEDFPLRLKVKPNR